jgi:DNA-directed RNA polymerase specialized sigma subunit
MAKLQQQQNREPTRAQLADYLGIELDQVNEAMAAKGASMCCPWTARQMWTGRLTVGVQL